MLLFSANGEVKEEFPMLQCKNIKIVDRSIHTTMNQQTIDRIRKFTEDRDWNQFHSPANLAKSIVIEAAELLECFQWSDDKYDLQD